MIAISNWRCVFSISTDLCKLSNIIKNLYFKIVLYFVIHKTLNNSLHVDVKNALRTFFFWGDGIRFIWMIKFLFEFEACVCVCMCVCVCVCVCVRACVCVDNTFLDCRCFFCTGHTFLPKFQTETQRPKTISLSTPPPPPSLFHSSIPSTELVQTPTPLSGQVVYLFWQIVLDTDTNTASTYKLA